MYDKLPPVQSRQAAAAVAACVGAQADDLVFVDNATTGANAVLRSVPCAPAMRSWSPISATAA